MAERTCRDCGVPISGLQRSGYCPQCRLRRCEVCRQPHGKGDRRNRCAACAHAAWVRRAEQEQREQDRRCRICGQPIDRERKSSRCIDCNQAIYVQRRAMLLRQGPRPCRDCGEPMPAGRHEARCRACHREYLKARPSRRQPCALCKERLRCAWTAYCRDCETMRRRWYRDLQSGDRAARLMGPHRTHRRWQERS